jgi:hypothetical protein
VRPTFYCESCAAPFWRRRNHKDARRFCSKRCAGVWHRARTLARVQAERAQRQIDRELQRAARQAVALLRWCPCGAALNRRSPGGRFCRACVAERIRAGHASRERDIAHCCPNCGGSFHGYEAQVFCSKRCAHQLQHKGRYPTLGRLPLEDRNQLAEMIALVRAARRQIDRDPKPSEMANPSGS